MMPLAGRSRRPDLIAAVLARPKHFDLARGGPAPLGARQIRFRVEGCGVCGSNLPVWEGRDWFQYPREPGAPGHEAWGIVEAVGADVTELRVGQRIACLSDHAFAETDVCDASAALPLPERLVDRPMPAEPLACAMNVFRRCGLEPADGAVVIGVGFLGALLIQLMASSGIRVLAVSRRPFARRIAEQCGAQATFDFAEAEAIVAAIGPAGCPCVIEAVGSQAALDLATRLVAVRGRLVIAGYHQDGPRMVNLQQWNWKGIDVINAHERDPEVYVRGMREAVAAVVEQRLRLDCLLTHRFPLTAINEAFELAVRRPDGFLKAWIDCRHE
jgi:threonine dehydrogenase-like Zn-dependent dehydrogenase